MGIYVIKPYVQFFAWLIAAVLVYLNLRMVTGQAMDFFNSNGNVIWKLLIILGGIIFVTLLVISFVYPLLKKKTMKVLMPVHKSTSTIHDIELPGYQNIAVALDLSIRDEQLIAYAMKEANAETRIILIHIVESASAKILGMEADDFETRKDHEKLEEYVEFLEQKGFSAISKLGFRNRQKEIPRLVKEMNADLLVIGAHGHKGVKDWLYGETIDAVRHQLKIPVLIVNADLKKP
jgi:manganese transport protein